MEIFLQLAVPIVIGLVVTVLRIGVERFAFAGHERTAATGDTWSLGTIVTTVGSLLFLGVQIAQIFWAVYASVYGLILVVVLLTAFAVAAKYGTGRGPRALLLCTALFGGYLLYWLVEKYLLSPEILPLFSGAVTGEAITTMQLFAVVGVSYIGFKLMHFYVDYRDGEIRNFSVPEFLSWLLFFPAIVAGPMQRFQAWQEQRAAPRLTIDDVAIGLRRIIIGVFMKVVLADRLYAFTLPAFSDDYLFEASPLALTTAACLYTIYLFLDFAGYSSIAIGTAIFWGIRLPENFDRPYIARNLSEFWNRWHMSLSSIFREYVFYPISIALRRSPTFRSRPYATAIIPPLITFLVVGIWHGAGISFIVLGIMHGLGLGWLAILKARPSRSRFRKWWDSSVVARLMAIAITFLYVTATFVFFGLPWSRVTLLLDRVFQ